MTRIASVLNLRINSFGEKSLERKLTIEKYGQNIFVEKNRDVKIKGEYTSLINMIQSLITRSMIC